MVVGVELQATSNHIARAIESNAEMIHHAGRLQTELQEQARRLAGSKEYLARAKAASALGQTIAPVAEWIMARAEETIRLVELALQFEESVRLGDECWQLALVSLDQEHKGIEGFFRGKLRETIRRHRVLWPAWHREWDRKCEDLLDRLDDLAETIAIGLNPEMRAEVERHIQEAVHLKSN